MARVGVTVLGPLNVPFTVKLLTVKLFPVVLPAVKTLSIVIDAFGNVKFAQEYTQKELLEEQMLQLKDTAKKLLAEEKYELLQELKEIYEKIKKEYDNL